MQYFRIEHLKAGMILAKSIIGDNGSLLVKSGNTISETILNRMVSMGFQGAYIEVPTFSDIIVDDVISDDIRAAAFEALRQQHIVEAVQIAKKMVRELKYKETLKLEIGRAHV